MAEPLTANVQAFQPYAGGKGKRISVTTTSGSTAYQIPGLTGGNDNKDARRVIVKNSGLVSAFIRLGQSNVTADTDGLEVAAGDTWTLTPPDGNPSGVWIAAITEIGATKLSVMAGVGS